MPRTGFYPIIEARDRVLDVTALALQAAAQDVVLHVIANNRAWGNAPSLAQAIATSAASEVGFEA